jgi:hypothetical protein
MFARRIVSIVAISGLLAGVSHLPAQSDEPVKVALRGQVVGEDDQPVAGASVTQIGWKQAGPAVKANAEGRFSVSVQTAANGYIYASLYAQSDDGRADQTGAASPGAEARARAKRHGAGSRRKGGRGR